MNKTYWFKWGTTFFIISVLLMISDFICNGSGTGGFGNFECMIFYIPLVIPISPFGTLFDSLRLEEPLETYVAMAIGVVLWTMIGMILGWIHGKAIKYK